jgi:hypothetical protein
MVYFIVGWIILWISSGCIGAAVLDYLGDPNSLRIGDRIILAEWIGVMVLSIILLAVSLVLPLSPWISLGITILLVSGSLSSSHTRNTLHRLIQNFLSTGKLCWVQCILLLGGWAIAAVMTRQVTWIDTGLYHAGAIQWLSRFGAVPGVALIHDRFSFTSSWFALAAPFNPVGIHSQAIAIANGFLMLLSSIHLTVALRHIIQGRAILADWFISIFYIFIGLATIGISLITDIFISPSPDAVIFLLAGITSWLGQVLHSPSIEAESPNLPNSTVFQNQFSPILLLLGVSAIAIKLSGIPILAVVLLFYVRTGSFQIRSLLQVILILLIGLAPVALFGIVTSGCAFYPSHTLCIELPWTISSDQANQELASIQGWMKWFGAPPPGTPYFPWVLLQWLQQSKANQLMAALLGLSVLSGAIAFIIWRKALIQSLNLTVILGIFGSLFIMISAPGLRFGLGYLILIPAWILAIACFHFLNSYNLDYSERAINRSPPQIRLLPLLLLCFIISFSISNRPLRQRIILPPPLPEASVTQAQINNIEYRYPNADDVLCWATPQPCTLGPIDAVIRLRSPNHGLGAGFEYAPNSFP